MNLKSQLRLIVLTFAWGGGGALQCSSAPEWRQIPVEARLMGETTRTTVDSELTRVFLAGGLDPQAGHAPTIQAYLRRYDARELNAENLKELSRETSPDFAAAYFMRRVLQSSENRAFQNRFHSHVRELRGESSPGLSSDAAWNQSIRDNYVFLFAPGLLYESKPETKSDMLPQRRLLAGMGYRTELLPVHQAGSVEHNARIIAEAVRRHRKSKIVVVSASKGGPDVAHALGAELSPAESRHVMAWVNVGGAIGGSPLADDLLDSIEMQAIRIYGWFLGADACELADSLSVRASRARRLRQNIPERIFVLNYVAVPFSGSVIPEVRGPYGRLREFGPNDGIVLLTAQAARGEQIILAMGSDHRFRDPEIDIKTTALARIVLERVEGRPRSAVRTARLDF